MKMAANALQSHAKPLSQKGYSTFLGVYLPSILSIFGVIIFLRLGEIVGSAGILKTTLIILLSSLITFITGLSISATATNMHVRSGGAYYMLSRSFGIEFGAAIGVSLYLAQVFGMAFYIEGFSEALLSIYPHFQPLVVKTTTLCCITLLALTSSSFALKSQILVLLLIALSLLSVLTGDPAHSFEISSATALSRGPPLSFWAAFAIFFPAVTGIEAGFSMSGDLKNPSRSLPIGTLGAVLTGVVVYLLLALFLWYRVPTEHLLSDPLILKKIARFPLLVLFGIWGATLSSALTSSLGGPRTLQALAYDGVVPKVFAKGFGPLHEPRVASAFSLLLICLVLNFGSINVIAPILTMFFLISYGMLNFASGLETLLGNPSWRPTIPIPSSISILGGILCIVAMLMIDSGATFLAFILITAFYLIVKKKGVVKRLDDIRVGVLSFYVKKAIYYLASSHTSTRSWHPNCVVFASHASQRGHLTEFASAVTQETGFLTTISIITSPSSSHEKLLTLKEATQEFYRKKRIRSLVEVIFDVSLYSGMERVITTYGLGSLSPNTVIMGAVPNANLSEKFVNLIKMCNALRKNVVIVKEGTNNYPYPQDGDVHTIDIWWDDTNRKNAHLTIILSHMLHSSPLWARHRIVIKCLTPNETARASRVQYLKEFLKKSRLNIEVRAYIAPSNQDSLFAAIQRYSSLSKLIFLGLKPPTANQSATEYIDYFSALSSSVDQLPPNTAFVMNSEHLDLEQIFK